MDFEISAQWVKPTALKDAYSNTEDILSGYFGPL